MTWSMIWKFSASCIDQIYKQNTTVSCFKFTADEVMFKTINELMLKHRWKKTLANINKQKCLLVN